MLDFRHPYEERIVVMPRGLKQHMLLSPRLHYDLEHSSHIETNECLTNNGGCWQDKSSNITACKDTFRGRVCDCPVVGGIQFKGDGYTKCEAIGPGHCTINHGGCWHDSQGGLTLSACQESGNVKCSCPPGFTGDGIKSCNDINECREKRACQCPECHCKNTWGSYECTCNGDLLYIRDHDICIAKNVVASKTTWAALWTILVLVAMAACGAYMLYKYRLRTYMDSEIRAIMAQYMPLESQADIPNHVRDDNHA